MEEQGGEAAPQPPPPNKRRRLNLKRRRGSPKLHPPSPMPPARDTLSRADLKGLFARQERRRSEGEGALVACPACGVRVEARLVNRHLDAECPSLALSRTQSAPATTARKPARSRGKGRSSPPVPVPADGGDGTVLPASTWLDLSLPQELFTIADTPDAKASPTTLADLLVSADDPVDRPQRTVAPPTEATATAMQGPAAPAMQKEEPSGCVVSPANTTTASDTTTATAAADDAGSEAAPGVKRCISCGAEGHWSRFCPLGPYYELNFRLVLGHRCVNHDALFSAEDQRILDQLHSLPQPALRLFARLFQRKQGWHQLRKLQYPEIEDLPGCVQLLAAHRLADNQLASLEEALGILTLAELASIRKTMRIRVDAGLCKLDLIHAMLAHARSQRTLHGDGSTLLAKHARTITGGCVRLEPQSFAAMKRLELLFFMPTGHDGKTLTTMVLQNLGKVQYPAFRVSASRAVFEDRGQLVAYQDALLLEARLEEACGRWNYGAALRCFEAVCRQLGNGVPDAFGVSMVAAVREAIEDESESEDAGGGTAGSPANPRAEAEAGDGDGSDLDVIFIGGGTLEQFSDTDSIDLAADPVALDPAEPAAAAGLVSLHLPEPLGTDHQLDQDLLGPLERDRPRPPGHFFAQYTAAWVHVRCVSMFVAVLDRLKLHLEAVWVLQWLLLQPCNMDSRGRWWDRLALNLNEHLKRPDLSLRVCRVGIQDSNVRTGHKLSLLMRGRRLSRAAKNTELHQFQAEFPGTGIFKAPEVLVRGYTMPDRGVGQKVFFLDGDVLCSVEELVIRQANELGWSGIHCENSFFASVFRLLMWEVIFSDQPDVFLSPYQAAPLDYRTDWFFRSREELIKKRLLYLRHANLGDEIQSAWARYEGRVGVSWDAWTPKLLAQLVEYAGTNVVVGVCDLLAQDVRHRSGGLPDLVLWRDGGGGGGEVKFVEVKSKNDRLSRKQMVWLHVLQALGASATVCNVDPTGSRVAARRRSDRSS